MARKFLTPVGLPTGSALPTGATGQLFYLTTDSRVYQHDGTTWLPITPVPASGSTNQVLAKTSGADYDVSWVDASTVSGAASQVHTYVKNGSGGPLTKGTPVYVSGANGTNVLVTTASNTSEATSSKTLGLLEQDLTTNGFGYVANHGMLSGLNTGTAAAGDAVWLGASGALIYGLANKPVAPAHLVYLGVVTKANSSTGEIFIVVQNGFELNELHNVQLDANASIADNEVLAWDSATSLWKNQTASEADLAALSGAAFTGSVSVTGDLTASGFLKSTNSSGDEGGQIDLTKAATNTTLTTGVTLDVYQNRLRIFETGGTNRGYYIDITTGGTSAGTNLVGGGGGSGTVTSITAGTTGLTGGTITTSGTIDIDPTKVPLLANNITTFAATTGATTLVVKQGATQSTTNLLEVQNTSASPLAVVTSGGSVLTSGNLAAGTTSALGTARLSVSGAASSVGLIVRGNATTPGNLQEWQTSTPTTVASVSATGAITGLSFSGSGAALTSLPAANVTGTLTSTVLGNSAVFIGTTSVALNRTTADLALTGISSVTLPGSTSGTIQLLPTAVAGTGTVLTLPATTGTLALTSQLPTVNNATLTLAVSGTGLSGSQTFTANQATGATFTVTSNATDANTVSTIVARDASGNFAAGVVTSSRLVSSVATGTAPLTVTSTTKVANLNADLLDDLTTATTSTVNTVVARDANASFAANVITATLTGNASGLSAGAAGSVPYQSAINTTAFLAAPSTNNSFLVYNTGTGAPEWDAPAEAMAAITGYTSTATAAGITTLTAASSYYQLFTGTLTQTVQLPVTSTLQLGWTYHVVNNSVGLVTINSSGANQVIVVPAGTTAMVTCIDTTVTTAAGWEAGLTDFSTYTGSGNLVLGTSPTLSGIPLAPTAAANTNSTQIATTAFVTDAVAVVSAPNYMYLASAFK